MANLPPRKRHSNAAQKSTSTPAPTFLRCNKVMTHGQASSNSNRTSRTVYANNSISRWFIAGLLNYDSIQLEPFDYDRKSWIIKGRNDEESEEMPWVKIVERILPDLIGCYTKAIKDLGVGTDVAKISFVAKLGTVLFDGNSVDVESIKKAAYLRTDSRNQIKKSFHTNVSSKHVEELMNFVVPKHGFDFESEKENYNVKIFDKLQPKSIISCKCTVDDGGSLKIHKTELSPVRHLVIDVSCLHKDLDLRLMFVTKKLVRHLDDDANERVNNLLKSAVIDPRVKGGLKWSFGNESEANRFSIAGVWHTKFKVYKNDRMRIKLRHADRFDHKTSTGGISDEVTIKLTGISKYFMDENVEEDVINEMTQEAVHYILEHFMSYTLPAT